MKLVGAQHLQAVTRARSTATGVGWSLACAGAAAAISSPTIAPLKQLKRQRAFSYGWRGLPRPPTRAQNAGVFPTLST